MAVTTASANLNRLAEDLLGDGPKIEYRQKPARGWWRGDERLGMNEAEAEAAIRRLAATEVETWFPKAKDVEHAIRSLYHGDDRPSVTVVGWYNDSLYVGWNWSQAEPDAEQISAAVGQPIKLLRRNGTIFTIVPASA